MHLLFPGGSLQNRTYAGSQAVNCDTRPIERTRELCKIGGLACELPWPIKRKRHGLLGAKAYGPSGAFVRPIRRMSARILEGRQTVVDQLTV